eukprot:scaffold17118_cov61-Cyclotella_meneghiniana.AAC.7
MSSLLVETRAHHDRESIARYLAAPGRTPAEPRLLRRCRLVSGPGHESPPSTGGRQPFASGRLLFSTRCGAHRSIAAPVLVASLLPPPTASHRRPSECPCFRLIVASVNIKWLDSLTPTILLGGILGVPGAAKIPSFCLFRLALVDASSSLGLCRTLADCQIVRLSSFRMGVVTEPGFGHVPIAARERVASRGLANPHDPPLFLLCALPPSSWSLAICYTFQALKSGKVILTSLSGLFRRGCHQSLAKRTCHNSDATAGDE